MMLFFIQIRKVKHSFVTIYFYNEEERKKGRFIAIISMWKWYLFHQSVRSS
jgi:hypothetical protein